MNESQVIRRSYCKLPLARFFPSLLLLLVGVTMVVADEEQDLTPRLSHIQDENKDRMPQLTAFPLYPSIARRDRIEGEAIVCFRIDSRGKVLSAKIKTSTHKIFIKPSLRAIRASSFLPLQPGQILQGSKTCRTYRYRLDPVPVDPDVYGPAEEE